MRLAFNHYVSIPLIILNTPFRRLMAFLEKFYAGAVAGAGIVLIVNIADGLSTYVFGGEKLSDKVTGALGLSNGDVL